MMTRLLALALLAFSLAACDTAGPTAVSGVEIGGPYTAASFRLLDATSGALHYDLSAAGATFEMDLAGDGTVSGDVFIPYQAFVESGTTDDIDGDFDVSFSGTYRATDRAVAFSDINADTFIDASPWEVLDGGRGLRFESTDDGLTFELVVTR